MGRVEVENPVEPGQSYEGRSAVVFQRKKEVQSHCGALTKMGAGGRKWGEVGAGGARFLQVGPMKTSFIKVLTFSKNEPCAESLTDFLGRVLPCAGPEEPGDHPRQMEGRGG